MKIRSTENEHFFQGELYKNLNAYSLQGLFMDANHTYDGWFPPVLLAGMLNVPHALMTFDKKNDSAEHIGLAFISELSHQAIRFAEDISPNSNVITGTNEIIRQVRAGIEAASSPVIKVE